jgi:hypothetical protein
MSFLFAKKVFKSLNMLKILFQNLFGKAKSNTIYVIFSFIGVLVILSAIFSFNLSSLFQSKSQQLEIALIANFEKQNAFEADLLEKGFQDGLKSIGVEKGFRIKRITDSENKESVEKIKAQVEDAKSTFSMVGPLSRKSIADFPELAEQLKIPLIVPRSLPKDLQDPSWSFAMQQNMFTKSRRRSK